jgi:translation initiation factor 3 subunit H
VQLEALTVMKVIKHCADRFPTFATGFLVGMDREGTLEVTNSFPFPIVDLPPEAQYEQPHLNAAAAAPRAKANAAYQTEYLKVLREVNIDANTVGWYTSCNLGNFVNMNFIENQYYYQKEMNERTIALVHDVSRTSQGMLSLRAFRLSSQFMTAYKEQKFTADK